MGMESMANTNVLGAERSMESSAKQRLLSLLVEADQRRRGGVGDIPPRGNFVGLIPLSYAQERLWFLDQLGMAGAAYNVPMALRLSGHLEKEFLQRSFSALVQRHEILRTRFQSDAGVPYQIVD